MPVLYAVFDRFLARPTWHSGRESDDAVFYRCLDHIIADPHFSAGEMGRYLADKVAGAGTPYQAEIDRLVAAAQAVRDYLVALLDDV